MTGFFSSRVQPSPENQQEVQNWYFIPVFEQFTNPSAENQRMWHFASQGNIVRQFFTSTEALKKAMSPRLRAHQAVSCYKVLLSSEQEAALTKANNNTALFTGPVNIGASNIRSLIILREQINEIWNPYFVEPISAVATCAA